MLARVEASSSNVSPGAGSNGTPANLTEQLSKLSLAPNQTPEQDTKVSLVSEGVLGKRRGRTSVLNQTPGQPPVKRPCFRRLFVPSETTQPNEEKKG